MLSPCRQVKDDALTSDTGSLPAQAAQYCGKQPMEADLRKITLEMAKPQRVSAQTELNSQVFDTGI